LLVAHLVEDEELGLRSEVRDVADARLLDVRLGLLRDVARIAAVFFLVIGSTMLQVSDSVG
jgi:hypothetical protein